MTIQTLLQKAHIDEPPIHITPLTGGANNQVYRIDFTSRPPLVCKRYFEHPQDKRKRLEAEFSFLSYAQAIGLDNVPLPLVYDQEKNLALYTWVSGSPVKKATDHLINQTLTFFLKLNQSKAKATHLPFASESCFHLADFLTTVEKKLTHCKAIMPNTPLNKEVKDFIEAKLIPTWKSLSKNFSPDTIKTISTQDLCITPSDFGFHNTLLKENKLYFLDFEYAGWDDPTKTVCDFFCQPKIPVPMAYFDQVATTVASLTTHPQIYIKRMELMLPICRVKWCCMLLNIFQKIGKERRRFANPLLLKKQQEQLQLAKTYLQESLHGLH